MTENLVATVEHRRSGARVIKLAGVLDEHNNLAELTEKVGAGIALINLAGVERINSMGTRDWVSWLATLDAQGTKPVLIACSPAIVGQLNRVKNFAGSAVVKSFQVPYHCATCSLDKLQLVYIADLGDAPYRAPSCACDGCGAAMMSIEDDSSYFAFVADLPKPKEPEPQPKKEVTVPPELARGSMSAVTDDHVKRISKPRLQPRDSRPSLSAFQLGDPKRPSEREIVLPHGMMTSPPTSRPYLIAVIVLLFLVVGILYFLLLN